MKTKESILRQDKYKELKNLLLIMEAMDEFTFQSEEPTDNTLYENMQYYMEYCEKSGYVTPQQWIDCIKGF